MKVEERFLRYVAFDTQSKDESDTFPSTEKQKRLAEALTAELQELGASDVCMDENGYVYGTIPASKGAEGQSVLALIAHMDTATEQPGANVRPRIVKQYDGGDLVLNEALGIVTRKADFPALSNYIGQDLIVTDGTTLLGADDKAGIAEIMTAAEAMLSGTVRHPEVRIVFTPDEEVGRGVDRIDMQKVNAAYGYTVDGEELGELEAETFNAASARVRFHGVCVHTGAAFGIMKNASLLAMEFHAMLPPLEVPAATRDRMGFFHLSGMKGCMEEAELSYLLRDHDGKKLEQKKEILRKAAELMNLKYGEQTAELVITDSYRNMYEKIMPEHKELIEYAREAMRELGIKPIEDPIRGGTDGARLSFMGLPCPNLGTGGHACHGCHEFIPIPSMEKVVELLKRLVGKFA